MLTRVPVAGWRADLVAGLLGLMSALALPPLHVLPVLLLAVPGLLHLVGAARTPWVAARRGFWFGFGHHVLGLYWITEAILLESARYWWFVPIAVPSLSVIMGLFIAVACAAAWAAAPGWRRLAMLAGAWVLMDLARQFIGTGFPWNPWGSVWAIPGPAGDVMIQAAAMVGTPGLTLATVALAGVPMLGWRGALGGVAVLGAWAAVGMWRLQQPEPPGAGVAVVLVQGNVAQGQKWDRASVEAVFERHLALSREGVVAAGGKPSVVVWPETATVYLLQVDTAARQAIVAAAVPASGGPSLGAVVGGFTFPAGSVPFSGDAPPYNSMLALTPGGVIAGTYDKWHLVPFGEYAPSWVPLSIKIVPGSFSFGRGPATLRSPGLPPFGGLICYEAIFPAQVVDRADRPEWIINITNDAWFGNSTGPRQHLAAARLRAVEEGLPLMRAANTGISAGFDAKGRELGRMTVGVAGVLTLDLPGRLPPTSFGRWGLVVPGLLALMMCGASILRRKRHGELEKRHALEIEIVRRP